MPTHNDKKKKSSKKGGQWSNWSSDGPTREKRTRSTSDDWVDSKSLTRKRYDKAYKAARDRGDLKFDFDGKPMSTDLEYRPKKSPSKTKKGEKMDPMPTRSTPIPPIKSSRKLTPGYKKPSTGIYTKKEKKPDTDHKVLGKGGKAKIKYAIAKVNPMQSASVSGKGASKRYASAKKTFQSTTRPVSEKDAYKPNLTRKGKAKLAKGVKKAMLGSEGAKGGKTTKRTQSGIATEKNMTTRNEKKLGAANLAKRKEKYGY